MTGQPAQTQLAGEAQHPGFVQAVSAVEAAGGVVANDVAAPAPCSLVLTSLLGRKTSRITSGWQSGFWLPETRSTSSSR